MKSAEKKEDNSLDTMRHSTAHLLAAAVMRMFPEAKLGVGPVIDAGFYYDMLLPRPLAPEDLSTLQDLMKTIAKEKLEFRREEMSLEDAIKFFKEKGQDFKVELLRDIMVHGTTNLNADESQDVDASKPNIASVYWTGDFVDLCRGPHVENTKKIGAYKLTHIAGAYWRGSEENPMLTRIYGLAFETRDELKAHIAMLEEAAKRDHRRLNKDLKIFAFDDMVGPGMPLWLPNGTVITDELEKLAKEKEFMGGYERVRTPHLAKEEMYLTSGHLPYYKDSMFPPMIEEDENGNKTTFYLRGMNCPHHHKIYDTEQRSYRDLPIRLAEYGTCYRYEKSGELMGLMRVRMLSMNDAHIYCTEEQFEAEMKAVNQMYKELFEILGIEKFVMRLSLHDPKYLGKKYIDEPELWLKTEAMVRKVLTETGIEFVEVANEAAFYGPKIDVQVWSSIGREFTLATNQVDFAVPERFGLTYVDSDGSEKTPLCIHRAPLSTHERMVGFLIEHFAGAFPTWLAPQQVAILSVAERHIDACESLKRLFMSHGIRVLLDKSNESVGKKIRNTVKAKAPYMLVIGDKEAPEGEWSDETVLSVRARGEGDTTEISLGDFITKIEEEIRSRRS